MVGYNDAITKRRDKEMTNINEQNKIEKIKNKYLTVEPTNADKLRKLDRKVRRPANLFAYIFGVFASLILGTGMCLSMKVIGANLNIALGIAIGVFGIVLCVANYYIYKAILKSRKNKYQQQILNLCDEALGNETIE